MNAGGPPVSRRWLAEWLLRLLLFVVPLAGITYATMWTHNVLVAFCLAAALGFIYYGFILDRIRDRFTRGVR